MTIRNFTIGTIGWLFMALGSTAGAWTISDNYDSDKVGTNPCGNFELSQWRDSSISSDESFSSPRSCKFRTTKGHTGFGATFNTPDIGKGEELWFQFKMFTPTGFDYYVPGDSGGRLKYISVGVHNTGGTPSTLFVEMNMTAGRERGTYTANLTSNNTDPYWHDFGSTGDVPQTGVWETYETYIKFDNVDVAHGGTGRVRFWKNNKLLGDITNLPTLNNASDSSDFLGIFTYWNGGSPKAQHLYIDDLLATNQRPSNTDANGNPYIGKGGNSGTTAYPLPPNSIQ